MPNQVGQRWEVQWEGTLLELCPMATHGHPLNHGSLVARIESYKADSSWDCWTAIHFLLHPSVLEQHHIWPKSAAINYSLRLTTSVLAYFCLPVQQLLVILNNTMPPITARVYEHNGALHHLIWRSKSHYWHATTTIVSMAPKCKQHWSLALGKTSQTTPSDHSQHSSSIGIWLPRHDYVQAHLCTPHWHTILARYQSDCPAK